jgi:hypothetical protein
MKKTGASVVQGAGHGTRPPGFSKRVVLREIRRQPGGHARRSTSYTVCLDRFNSLAISVTFFRSAFICKIIVATMGVTLFGMPLGLPPLLMTGGVPTALMMASIFAACAVLPAVMSSARTSVS